MVVGASLLDFQNCKAGRGSSRTWHINGALENIISIRILNNIKRNLREPIIALTLTVLVKSKTIIMMQHAQRWSEVLYPALMIRYVSCKQNSKFWIMWQKLVRCVTMTLLTSRLSQLTTVLRVFIRVILAVIITVTHPALWYTVTCVTLEAIGLTCMVAH